MRKKKKDEINITIDSRPVLSIANDTISKPLAERHWLYNPVAYAQLRGDYSLLEQRVMLGVLECLQKRIVEGIEARKQQSLFPDVITKDEVEYHSSVKLRVPLSTLGVKSSNYADLEKAVDNLSTVRAKIYTVDKDSGAENLDVITLFSKIRIPMSEVKRKNVYNVDEVINYRSGYIEVTMNSENLRDIFSLDNGFIKHYSHITNVAKKKYTPKLYVLLSKYKDVRHKKYDYIELLKDLSLVGEDYSPNNKKGGKSEFFETWSRVRQKVLEPVKKEIDDLAAENNINFRFEYEPIYPVGKTRGNPMAINFTIIPSELGKENEEKRYISNAVHTFMERMTKWCPDLKRKDLADLLKGLSDEDCKSVIKYGYTVVRNIVEKKQPDDVASYALAMLKKYKTELQQAHTINEKVEQEEKVEKKSVEDPTAFVEEWKRIMDAYNGSLKPYLLKARHSGSWNGFICIKFKTEKELDEFNAVAESNKEEMNKLMSVVRSVVGMKLGRFLVRGLE